MMRRGDGASGRWGDAMWTIVVLLLFVQCGFAQEKENAVPRRKGSINGRVVADDGQPMRNVRVFVSPMGVSNGASRSFTTDDEGNFIADGLLSGTYSIGAKAPAYIAESNREPDKRMTYRLGETATITMRKGGVITGRVTNQKGEVMQNVGVTVTRVRDEAGRKIPDHQADERSTDDRGVYRIYGLQPGSYLVAVSGGEAAYMYGGPGSPYDEYVPIYFPSSSREAATEVKVQAGEEVHGIDIRYRTEKGHLITGVVTGLPLKSKSGELANARLNLYRLPGGSSEQESDTYEMQEQKGFVFHGVADGEYEIKATSSDWRDEDADLYASSKRRVTVKGNNVSGVIVALFPLASVVGQVVIEATPEKDRKPECPVGRDAALDEVLLFARRDEVSQAPVLDADWLNQYQPVAASDKGAFKLRALEAGRYYLNTRLPNETWYIKSITLKAPTPKPDIANPKAQTAHPLDVGKQGLNVKSGDRLTGLTVTIAEGAANVSGRVVGEKDKPLPTRWRVHLIPAEKEAATDVLRYAEYKTKADGAFSLSHLAPGKYWLLAHPVPEEETDEKPAKPAAWDAATRTKLRTEAEAANNAVELTPCQRVKDYNLRLREK